MSETRARRRRHKANLSQGTKPPKEKAAIETMKLRTGLTQRGPTPGRNEPCNCGSGEKYKKCCGAGESPYRFTLVYEAKMTEWRNKEGKIVVFSDQRRAFAMLRKLGFQGWKVGGIGPTKWSQFKEFHTLTRDGETVEGWVLDPKDVM